MESSNTLWEEKTGFRSHNILTSAGKWVEVLLFKIVHWSLVTFYKALISCICNNNTFNIIHIMLPECLQ